MAKGLYRLRKPESKHQANQVPGRHELRSGRVVTHEEPQEFDPEDEGIAQYCEPVEQARPAAEAQQGEEQRTTNQARPDADRGGGRAPRRP